MIRSPIQLNSRPRSYREHFLESGLFVDGPLSAIIRNDAFRAVKGFSGECYVGDLELWLTLAARYAVTIPPPRPTWWSQDEQAKYIHREHRTRRVVL